MSDETQAPPMIAFRRKWLNAALTDGALFDHPEYAPYVRHDRPALLASPIVQEIVRDERERCAKVAELAPYSRNAMVCGCSEGLADFIAAAIRKEDT